MKIRNIIRGTKNLVRALTRAKEKLIITGISKDLEKILSKNENYYKYIMRI